jgi:hypothetical protein
LSLCYLFLKENMKRQRRGNLRRDWKQVEDFIDNRSDYWFKRSYRVSRQSFNQILSRVAPSIEAKNKEMAIRSSGSFVSPKVLLAATLRFLAGASCIDLVDIYKLPETSPHTYIWRTIDGLHSQINNISLPKSRDE